MAAILKRLKRFSPKTNLNRDFAPENMNVCKSSLKSKQTFGYYRAHTLTHKREFVFVIPYSKRISLVNPIKTLNIKMYEV